MPVTMRDVAEQAGVSIKTVSRVVNDQGEISAETRERVQTAIQALGYRPNIVARSLVSGKTFTLALILPRMSHPHLPEVVEGAEEAARRHGFSVLISQTGEEDAQAEIEAVAALAGKRVDGILLCESGLGEKKIARLSEEHGVPLSALSLHRAKGGIVGGVSGAAGLHESTSHLLRLGHRAIGYLGWKSPDEDDRLEGYRRALEENGVKPKKRRAAFAPQATADAGREAAKALLKENPELTALATYSDLLAIGALKACAESGRRVPEELAIVGFDDLPAAALVTPSLTTMRVPRRELGERMMERLLQTVSGSPDMGERTRVKPELVIRESCGASLAPGG